MKNQTAHSLEILGDAKGPVKKILTPEAIQFLIKLHRKFNSRRLNLIHQRKEIQNQINQGKLPSFLPETKSIRQDLTWKVAPTPKDLIKRWVEITGPTERKMLINALNSGADVFMADFEDANSPTWPNMIEGQQNLIDAVNNTISLKTPEGKEYLLKEKTAVLMVRPRGWHLDEKHVSVDGESFSASLFDFGLYFFHNAKNLIKKGSGPYFYLPKLENHKEARLWNDVFIFAQEELQIPIGTIRATVLIETILAAFEMEEILFELREHAAGLNAGRWDYIFSIIKKFQNQDEWIFPDRGQITMTVPFMRAYSELLVKTCHRRGAHAIGGMAAFIPNRKNTEITEIALKKVEDDKIRESSDGFDGTWVAHPDLVETAKNIFAKFLKDKPNQKERLREDVDIKAEQLLNFEIPGGKISYEGVHSNISIALHYLESWLRGQGAVALNNLMEDAATAEISRAQIWQWLHYPKTLKAGHVPITNQLYQDILKDEVEKFKNTVGETPSKIEMAKNLLNKIILNENFEEFLTTVAYKELN